MPYPRYCRNPECHCFCAPPAKWCKRNGTYSTLAHGRVQRFKCSSCGCTVSMQSESVYYYSKRRLDLARIYSRVRGGSSLRDIGREIGCSRTAIANAVLRLGRQAMGSHLSVIAGMQSSGRLSFDGLISSVTSRDYPSQITTLADSQQELILAMTHCVTDRGGTRTEAQRSRRESKRSVWRPATGGLTSSITLLVNELSRFAGSHRLHIDTDEHPIYPKVMGEDRALRWFREARRLKIRRTPGTAPRTTGNPLFLMNYIDRMIRHRMKEHTRETIAFARNSTYQMHRMWIFAWDHNTRQPARIQGPEKRSRIERAGAPMKTLNRLRREFYTRRPTLKGMIVPESIRRVWHAQLDSPPVRWRTRQKSRGPVITAFAKLDLTRSWPQGQ